MAKTNCIDMRRTLSKVVSKRFLEKSAVESGFIVRDRKIDAVAFFWTLVLGFGVGSAKSFASLRRCYERETGESLVPSAFYDRFTPALVAWLECVLTQVLSHAAEPARALRGRLSAFQDVLLMDGTVLRLHDQLEKCFAACRTNHTKAAAKLTVVMSVVGRGPRRLELTSERRHDSKLHGVGEWVRGRLLLFDLGYYSYLMFSTIGRYGGFFVTRLKDNANPVIVDEGPLCGQSLQDVLASIRRPVLDTRVQVRFKRKNGSIGHAIHRVVAIRNDETRRYHLYITNVAPEMLDAQDIARVYAARWEIEILFRQLKSQFRLDQFPSSKKEAVRALIMASIITLVVSRTFWMDVQRRNRHLADRIPHERFAKLFEVLSQPFLTLLIAGRRSAARRQNDLMRFLLKEMIDPNRTRSGGLIGELEGVFA